jgi:hypothetical protein
MNWFQNEIDKRIFFSRKLNNFNLRMPIDNNTSSVIRPSSKLIVVITYLLTCERDSQKFEMFLNDPRTFLKRSDVTFKVITYSRHMKYMAVQTGGFLKNLFRTVNETLKADQNYSKYDEIYPMIIDGSVHHSETADLEEFCKMIQADGKTMIQREMPVDDGNKYWIFGRSKQIEMNSVNIKSVLEKSMLVIPIYFANNPQKRRGWQDEKVASDLYSKELKKPKSSMNVGFIEDYLDWRANEIDMVELSHVFSTMNPRDGGNDFKENGGRPFSVSFAKPIVILDKSFPEYVKTFSTNELSVLKTVLNDQRLLKSYEWVQILPWSTEKLANGQDLNNFALEGSTSSFKYLSGKQRYDELIALKAKIVMKCYFMASLIFNNNIDSYPFLLNAKNIGMDSVLLEAFQISKLKAPKKSDGETPYERSTRLVEKSQEQIQKVTDAKDSIYPTITLEDEKKDEEDESEEEEYEVEDESEDEYKAEDNEIYETLRKSLDEENSRRNDVKRMICKVIETGDVMYLLDEFESRIQKIEKITSDDENVDIVISSLLEDLKLRVTTVIRECVLEKNNSQ